MRSRPLPLGYDVNRAARETNVRHSDERGSSARATGWLRWLFCLQAGPVLHHRPPARPLVSSAGAPLGSTYHKALSYLGLVLLASVLGFAFGALVWVVFQASFFLGRELWEAVVRGSELLGIPFAKGLSALVICAVGGVLMGLWTQRFGGSPEPFMHVLRKARRTGRYESDGLVPTSMGVVLPQILGASVGVAAGLVGVIATGCTRIGSTLRRAGLDIMRLPHRSAKGIARSLARAPFAETRAQRRRNATADADTQDPLAYDFRPWAKGILYSACVALGVVAFAWLVVCFGTQATLPRFGGIEAAGSDLLWAIPCVLMGWAGAVIFYVSDRGSRHVAGLLSKHPVITPLVGGVVLGVVAAELPGVLFSGIAQTPALLNGWTGVGAIALLATGICKFALTPWCISMGWRGGQIYPCVFASLCCGFGISALSGADPALCISLVAATCMSCELRSPILSFALLLLCFPLKSTLWLAACCLLGAHLPLPCAQADSSKR
jgi:hypothetical protein